MSTKRASNRQTPKWKNSAYAGTRLIRTGTTLSNLVLKVFLSQLRTDYCSGSPKDYGYIIDYKDLFKSLEGAVQDYTVRGVRWIRQRRCRGAFGEPARKSSGEIGRGPGDSSGAL